MDIGELKIKEISFFLDLIETKSVRELARRLDVNPSYITKNIQNLESKLEMKLLDRSLNGVKPTPQAMEISKYLKGIRGHSESLSGHYIKEAPQEFLTFATTSFLSTHLLAQVFNKVEKKEANLRFRQIDLPPSQFIPVGMRGGFNFCVHMENLDWPKTWESIEVGRLKWILCCRKNHPLTKKCSLAKVLKFPFVYPVYWTNEGVRYGDDNCPMSISKRRKGHETSTATSAAKIISHSDHIGFLPEIVAREGTALGYISVLHVPAWPLIEEPVYLSVKADAVKKKRRDQIKNIIGELLESQL